MTKSNPLKSEMKDSQDWLDSQLNKLVDKTFGLHSLQVKEVTKAKSAIRKHILQEVEQELEEFCTQIQDRAGTTPPNLLLNEVVNIRWDRVAGLRNKFNNKYKEV